MVNRPKRRLRPEWEIHLSDNCTVTPMLMGRIRSEKCRQKRLEEAENKKIWEAS